MHHSWDSWAITSRNSRETGSNEPIGVRSRGKDLVYRMQRDQDKAKTATRSFKTAYQTITINTTKNPHELSARGVWRGGPDSRAVIGGRKYDFIRKSIFFFFTPDSSAVLLASKPVSEKTRVVAIIRALPGPSRGIRGYDNPPPAGK